MFRRIWQFAHTSAHTRGDVQDQLVGPLNGPVGAGTLPGLGDPTNSVKGSKISMPKLPSWPQARSPQSTHSQSSSSRPTKRRPSSSSGGRLSRPCYTLTGSPLLLRSLLGLSPLPSYGWRRSDWSGGCERTPKRLSLWPRRSVTSIWQDDQRQCLELGIFGLQLKHLGKLGLSLGVPCLLQFVQVYGAALCPMLLEPLLPQL
jgi:hypothetical protein